MKRGFWNSGQPFIWSTGAALMVVLFLLFGLFVIVLSNGLFVFWPKNLNQYELKNGEIYIGEENAVEFSDDPENKRYQVKIGNREFNQIDFKWIKDIDLSKKVSQPKELLYIERSKGGNFYGRVIGASFVENFSDLENTKVVIQKKFEQVKASLASLKSEEEHLYSITSKLGNLQIDFKKMAYDKRKGKAKGNFEEFIKQSNLPIDKVQKISKAWRDIDLDFACVHPSFLEKMKLTIETYEKFKQTSNQVDDTREAIQKDKLVMADGMNKKCEISLSEIIRFYQPNQLSYISKVGIYFSKIWELFTDDPREVNTEGGLKPAIIGTISLVFLMSVISFPMGVISGVYLREYAKEGMIVRFVRIAVNNLAGIPSIVYGIFGLGFFVYLIGGSIDAIFYPHLGQTPKFNTGGVLWASLTLGILTVPVVIVATEEALSAIPMEVRQGSLALGATKFQTLYKVLVPMASPGILTGFILAMSRAAGEVAPLMITGAQKFVLDLPLDGEFPFVHLERKFMHLGFHIYDVGFQSPNVEAALPMVYITTLLLLLIVFVMSSLAIWLRNWMKKKVTIKSF